MESEANRGLRRGGILDCTRLGLHSGISRLKHFSQVLFAHRAMSAAVTRASRNSVLPASVRLHRSWQLRPNVGRSDRSRIGQQLAGHAGFKSSGPDYFQKEVLRLSQRWAFSLKSSHCGRSTTVQTRRAKRKTLFRARRNCLAFQVISRFKQPLLTGPLKPPG